MNELWKLLIIVCPLVFLGGFVDSIAGGGGLITLPAYMMVGLPTHLAAGTNKLAAGCGTVVSAVNYLRSGKVVFRIALPAAGCALLSSALGTYLATLLSDEVLKILLLAALPCIAVFLAVKKDFGKETASDAEPLPRRKEFLISCVIGLVVGAYDGLIGPGTGTFLLMLFAALLHLDLLTAGGCAKIANLASNIAAAIVWSINGSVLWMLLLPAAVCQMLGSFCGSRFAIRGGTKRVRGMVFIVLGLLFIKVLSELFTK